jgi:CDGSH-type Zn-finger protein/uncharacterized Fe-S cluster protein YjdI
MKLGAASVLRRRSGDRSVTAVSKNPSQTREHLIHLLAEAAEIEHNLMCTYLYAAFSLKAPGTADFSAEEAEAVSRWRSVIARVAIEEMGHLAEVWNIASALGGAPQFGRANFPLEPGNLPAGIVVKLAPFSEACIQHFIHLERPASSSEPEGRGFESELTFRRGSQRVRLVPMALDYDTVGEFYEFVGRAITEFAGAVGERVAFSGDPALQLTSADAELPGIEAVRCAKTAARALLAIVQQGEGAPVHAADSHFERFVGIRDELRGLLAKNPGFSPAHPAAVNPLLRPPIRATGRIFLEDELAASTVDLANTAYALMLRLLAYSYQVPRPLPEKALAIDLSRGLMRVVTTLGERAATLPAGPSAPHCNAGMSFTALRGSVAFPPGPGARRFFVERLDELLRAATVLDAGPASDTLRRVLANLVERAERGFASASARGASAQAAPVAAAEVGATGPATTPPVPNRVNGVDEIEGKKLTLIYEGKKCIHSRFCVTWGPRTFLANVEGPWIHPDAMDVEELVEIAHVCPSGAIRYRRKDGKPDESAPPVNLLSVRESGPYAVRAELAIAGEPAGFRATLCRCGASKHKPYCDGSHKEIGFSATGEPPTGAAEMLAARNGPLAVEPLPDGPLQVRGNLEVVSGTGRVVARVTQTRLCRCGGSANKPFCDGTHARIGFRST